MDRKPDMVTFMGGKVMPEMARLLGHEPFDYPAAITLCAGVGGA